MCGLELVFKMWLHEPIGFYKMCQGTRACKHITTEDVLDKRQYVTFSEWVGVASLKLLIRTACLHQTTVFHVKKKKKSLRNCLLFLFFILKMWLNNIRMSTHILFYILSRKYPHSIYILRQSFDDHMLSSLSETSHVFFLGGGILPPSPHISVPETRSRPRAN